MPLLTFEALNGQEVVNRLRTGARSVKDVLLQEMRSQMARAADWSRANRLSGDPLNRRTGRLSRSVTPFASLQGAQLIGGLSSNVPYAHVHELGGTFNIPAYTRRPARTTTPSGNFRKRTAEQQVSSVEVREHTATFKQRAFLRPSLLSNRDQVLVGLRNAAVKALA